MADNIKIPETIGLPPSGWIPDYFIKNTLPVVEITPCSPSFDSGSLNVFRLTSNWREYDNLLKFHGYERPNQTQSIRLAMIADSFPTDTFTNEYSETFLEGMANTASAGASQIAQMFGANSATQVIRNLSTAMERSGGAMGMAGSALGGALNFGKGAVDALLNKENPSMIRNMGHLINKSLAGQRIDFPMLWQNSAFSPSYTFTVRLYNPMPGDREMTNKYIIAPLAAILCLGLPKGTGETYNWPFFHRMKVPGLWSLPSAAISNVTVVKGGDQQQIAYNNRMAMCDVRVDVISLYGSIIATTADVAETGRPTLKSYLNNMLDEKKIEKRIHDDPEFIIQNPNNDATAMEFNSTETFGETTSTTVLNSRVSQEDSAIASSMNQVSI